MKYAADLYYEDAYLEDKVWEWCQQHATSQPPAYWRDISRKLFAVDFVVISSPETIKLPQPPASVGRNKWPIGWHRASLTERRRGG